MQALLFCVQARNNAVSISARQFGQLFCGALGEVEGVVVREFFTLSKLSLFKRGFFE
jgi:hypothetical protein